jgi:hypothetical protein
MRMMEIISQSLVWHLLTYVKYTGGVKKYRGFHHGTYSPLLKLSVYKKLRDVKVYTRFMQGLVWHLLTYV